MFQFLAGDESAVTLIESPNDALKPRVGENELPCLNLNLLDLTNGQISTTDTKASILINDSVCTNATRDKASRNGYDMVAQQDFKFTYPIQLQPLRQPTLEQALLLQVSEGIESSVSYRTVSETIIRTICTSLNLGSENASFLIKDSKTMDNIAQTIQDFVSTSFVIESKVNNRVQFVPTGPRSQGGGSRPNQTTLEFYSKILPIDLFERSREDFEKKRSNPSCMAMTKKGSRCTRNGKLDGPTLEDLIQELRSISRPRDFSKVIKTLLNIVDKVFCATSHLNNARLAIRELYEYFCRSTTSSSREIELKRLDHWLQKLALEDDLETESNEVNKNDDSTTTSGPVPHVIRSSVTNGLAQGLRPLVGGESKFMDPAESKSLFVFEHSLDYAKAGFKKEEHDFVPNLTHKTLRIYKWPPKYRDLNTQQLVKYIANLHIQKKDMKRRGCVYVYGHTKSFGFIKIGRSNTVGKRLTEWEMQCSYLIHEHQDLLQGMDRQVLHPQRLEALIHAALKDKRYEVLKCENCESKHIEWFQVTAKEAQKVVREWTLWMQTEPYDERGHLKPERAQMPVVGDSEPRPIPVEKRSYNLRSKSDRRTSGQRHSMAASSETSYSASVHPMETRFQGRSM